MSNLPWMMRICLIKVDFPDSPVPENIMIYEFGRQKSENGVVLGLGSTKIRSWLTEQQKFELSTGISLVPLKLFLDFLVNPFLLAGFLQ
jgi:hypothetical protein